MRFIPLATLRNSRLNIKNLRIFRLYSISRTSHGDVPLRKLSANSERHAFPLKIATGGMILPTAFLRFVILGFGGTCFCVPSRTALFGRFATEPTAELLFHDTNVFL